MADRNKLQKVAIRLVKDGSVISDHPINSPEDAVSVMGEYLKEMDRELVCAINLKSNGIPINCTVVSIGSISAAIVEPREVFKAAILSNASGIILMHCHPSGSLVPSKEDMKVTERLLCAGKLLGIDVLDHVIVGAGTPGFYSFKSEDVLPRYNKDTESFLVARKVAVNPER